MASFTSLEGFGEVILSKRLHLLYPFCSIKLLQSRKLLAPVFGVILQRHIGASNRLQHFSTIAGKSVPRTTTYISCPKSLYILFPMHPRLATVPCCKAVGSAIHVGLPSARLRSQLPLALPLPVVASPQPVRTQTAP